MSKPIVSLLTTDRALKDINAAAASVGNIAVRVRVRVRAVLGNQAWTKNAVVHRPKIE